MFYGWGRAGPRRTSQAIEGSHGAALRRHSPAPRHQQGGRTEYPPPTALGPGTSGSPRSLYSHHLDQLGETEVETERQLETDINIFSLYLSHSHPINTPINTGTLNNMYITHRGDYNSCWLSDYMLLYGNNTLKPKAGRVNRDTDRITGWLALLCTAFTLHWKWGGQKTELILAVPWISH